MAKAIALEQWQLENRHAHLEASNRKDFADRIIITPLKNNWLDKKPNQNKAKNKGIKPEFIAKNAGYNRTEVTVKCKPYTRGECLIMTEVKVFDEFLFPNQVRKRLSELGLQGYSFVYTKDDSLGGYLEVDPKSIVYKDNGPNTPKEIEDALTEDGSKVFIFASKELLKRIKREDYIETITFEYTFVL